MYLFSWQRFEGEPCEDFCPQRGKFEKGRWINPGDKYKRRKGCNVAEDAEFGGLCMFGSDQIISCYRNHDNFFNADCFAVLCRDCPYVRYPLRDDLPLSITQQYRKPQFIDKLADTCVEKPKRWVYFITDGQFVKIGIASNVKNRLSGIQTGNPRTCSVICAIPVRDEKAARMLERALHGTYKPFSVSGEWFDILNYINVKEFADWFPAKV